MRRPWIGVDLDGTLALYHGWPPGLKIGPPIPRMVEKVKLLLEEGTTDIRIFTARIDPRFMKEFSEQTGENITVETVTEAIEKWCEEHIGRRLVVTATKDLDCVGIWDDRAVQVINNQGYFLTEVILDGNH